MLYFFVDMPCISTSYRRAFASGFTLNRLESNSESREVCRWGAFYRYKHPLVAGLGSSWSDILSADKRTVLPDPGAKLRHPTGSPHIDVHVSRHYHLFLVSYTVTPPGVGCLTSSTFSTPERWKVLPEPPSARRTGGVRKDCICWIMVRRHDGTLNPAN